MRGGDMSQRPQTDELRDDSEVLGAARLRRLRETLSGDRRSSRIPCVAPQSRPGGFPLSYAQERLWFLEQTGLLATAYSIPMALELRGSLDVSVLEKSIAEVMDRHEI